MQDFNTYVYIHIYTHIYKKSLTQYPNVVIDSKHASLLRPSIHLFQFGNGVHSYSSTSACVIQDIHHATHIKHITARGQYKMRRIYTPVLKCLAQKVTALLISPPNTDMLQNHLQRRFTLKPSSITSTDNLINVFINLF